MSVRRLILLSCLFALAVPGSAPAARPSILHGRSVQAPGYLAFLTTITGDAYFTCGGTAIRPNVLLTAAHCMVDWKKNTYVTADNLYMVFGLADPLGSIRGDGPVPDDVVEEYVTAPNYGAIPRSGEYVNDVALLRLRQPAPSTLGILPASSIGAAAGGKRSVVVGWGIQDRTQRAPAIALMHAELTIRAPKYCGRYFRPFNRSTMLCAQSPTQSPCSGDDGGPLLVADAGHRVYVAGVASFGIVCRSGYPSAYANVASGPLARFVNQQADRLQQKADAESVPGQPTAPEGAAPNSR